MKMPMVKTSLCGQRGQSLVEVCIACIALVPLAIGLVYVGQYIHIKQTTQQAAREAAWDAAVARATYTRKTPDTAAEESQLRGRYFAGPNSAVEAQAQAPEAFADTMLLDYSGRPLLDPDRFALAVYSNQATPGIGGKVSKIMDKATGFLSKIPFSHGGVFPPDSNGYITARVLARTNKADHFKPFDTLDLDFQSQTVLLADAWNADGGGERDTRNASVDIARKSPVPSRTVRSAITYLAPATAIFGNGLGKGISKVFNIMGSVPLVNHFFPMQGFNPGRTAPDVIPYDKLKPYKP